MLSKIRYFSDLLARFIIEIEYRMVLKKLKREDFTADVDDQRLHHFSSY